MLVFGPLSGEREHESTGTPKWHVCAKDGWACFALRFEGHQLYMAPKDDSLTIPKGWKGCVAVTLLIQVTYMYIHIYTHNIWAKK